MPLAQMEHDLDDKAQSWKNYLNFKLISNDTNYSKFNVFHTLDQTIAKLPLRSPTHHMISNDTQISPQFY
jgi:hypothetical protein